MPARSEIDLRDRALIAFTILTGARHSALASIKLKHVDLMAGRIYQDPPEVRTKFSKPIETIFFPVGADIRSIVEDWVNYLQRDKLWSSDDPLFPRPLMGQNDVFQFEIVGLERKHWTSASRICAIFRHAFEAAGLPYFNPHSFRHTLVRLGQQLCRTPEDFKAYSQNLGHEGVLTTFTSYGEVGLQRQSEIIRDLALIRKASPSDPEAFAEAVVRRLRTHDKDEQF
jgi:integrase